MTSNRANIMKETTTAQSTSGAAGTKTNTGASTAKAAQYAAAKARVRSQIKNKRQQVSQEISALQRELDRMRASNERKAAAKRGADAAQNAIGGDNIDPVDRLVARGIGSVAGAASNVASRAAGKATGYAIAKVRNFLSRRLVKNSYETTNPALQEKCTCTYRKLKNRLTKKMVEDAPVNHIGGGENIAGVNPPAIYKHLNGIGSGSTPKTLARRHNVKVKNIAKQLGMGKKVEQEHTKNIKLALKIAKDHVYEDPRYYSKLRKMEKENVEYNNSLELVEKSAAWQRKEGKNKHGGLNEKGRKSYERENPGSNLKAPVGESNPKGKRKKRQNSFCARMKGMKSKLTGEKTKNDPNSRINKSLRKWNCR